MSKGKPCIMGFKVGEVMGYMTEVSNEKDGFEAMSKKRKNDLQELAELIADEKEERKRILLQQMRTNVKKSKIVKVTGVVGGIKYKELKGE